MRSTVLHFAALIVPAALAGGLTLAACGADETSAKFDGASDAAPAPEAPPTFGASDAAASTNTRATRGSPLCAVTEKTCLPDDDGSKELSRIVRERCSDADASADACRLTWHLSEYRPECLAGDQEGIDGVSCAKGSDCAAGFDCVEGEKGPVCRRYCCTGSCEDQTAQNGGATFCDIQKLVELPLHRAPVCMPIKACKLLVDGECGDRETCAIVTEKGVTGCVPRGGARAGESCDAEHCGFGLTCLGSPGDRRCYKLCRTEGSAADCGPTQTCTTGSVFQDNTFGVCKDN